MDPKDRPEDAPKSNSSTDLPPPPPRRRRRRALPQYAPRGMSFSSSIVVALVFAFTIIYMVWQAYGFFTPSINTEVVRIGTMEMQVSIPGIIVRNEHVYTAEREGRVNFVLQDFERVRMGTHVASIQDADIADQSILDVAEVEAMIMQVHDMRHHTVSDPAVELINTNITSVIERSMHYFTSGDVGAINALLEFTDNAIYRRNQLIIAESLHARADVSRQYDLLMQQIEHSSTEMLSTRSGIFSPFVDGYEDEFVPYTMRTIPHERILRGIDYTTVVPARDVLEDESVYKVVGNVWYIVTFMPSEIAHTFTQGERRTFYVENAVSGRFVPITMRIDLIERDPRYSLVILRSTRYVIEFLNQRSVNIRITDSVQSGLKIAASAIAVRQFVRIPQTHVHGLGDDLFVQHSAEGGQSVNPIPIVAAEQTLTHVYVLQEILPLGLGDSLIPMDRSLGLHTISDTDMSIVHGVYRANLGYADFRQIHLDADMQQIESHVLLDPTLNPGLRQFDTIVTDAMTVRQGQPIN